MNRFFSFGRLFAMLGKEFVQMRRDRVTFAMMLGVPLMQLLLFGFAINLDVKGLTTALVIFKQDAYTRSIVSAFEQSKYFRVIDSLPSVSEAEALMQSGKASVIITVPADFTRKFLNNNQPKILIEVDASDPSAASNAIKGADTLVQKALQSVDRNYNSQQVAMGKAQVIVHQKYNPEGITQFNIVPGLLGVILQMTMMMMTAMSLTRETERGTMENLLAMPANGLEIMLGKVLPFFVIGAVQVVIILTSAKLLFGVPFVGSISLLVLGVMLFILGLVLLGYAFSTFAKSQMQAMQLTFFFFLPSILLSGFMFPFNGMPGWAQVIGELLPLTHFLRIVRSIMLKGSSYEALFAEFAVLVAFIFVYATLAMLRFRRTLD